MPVEIDSLHPQAGSGRFVYLAAGFAALGGLLFGYDTGVISGAVIFVKKEFGLSTFPQELVVSMVLLGAAAGALTGGKLADRSGSRADNRGARYRTGLYHGWKRFIRILEAD